MKFRTIVKKGQIMDPARYQYDIILENGKVIDFGRDAQAGSPIYINDGVFVQGSAEADACLVVDAKGCLVVPGLIDLHTHSFSVTGEGGTSSDLQNIPNGVTTALDAGSAGTIHFKAFYESDIAHSVSDIKALLNVSSHGLITYEYGENIDPKYYCPEDIMALFQQYPTVLRGLKVRMGKAMVGELGLTPVIEAVKIADYIESNGHPCIVEVHANGMPENISIAEVASVLRKGDIIAHCYNIKSPILNEKGEVGKGVWAARERGVLFDACGGRIAFSIDIIKKAFAQGFYPDIIASDITSSSKYVQPPVSLPHIMSMYLALGMPCDEIIKAVTYTPAKAIGILGEAGTLKQGTAADAAVLRLVDKEVTFFDGYGEIIKGERFFLPLMTIKNGQLRFRQSFFLEERL